MKPIEFVDEITSLKNTAKPQKQGLNCGAKCYSKNHIPNRLKRKIITF